MTAACMPISRSLEKCLKAEFITVNVKEMCVQTSRFAIC